MSQEQVSSSLIIHCIVHWVGGEKKTFPNLASGSINWYNTYRGPFGNSWQNIKFMGLLPLWKLCTIIQ